MASVASACVSSVVLADNSTVQDHGVVRNDDVECLLTGIHWDPAQEFREARSAPVAIPTR